ncbi:MAG: GNAT family N-acetyltransferase [Oscillospiraceae bacterium]|nr:GNAT family N-acetyltransferase [Oscillospiraceae bacterium]
MRFESLDHTNVDGYIAYLKRAFSEEPDMITAEQIDEAGIKARIANPFYQNTKSILAMENNKVVGRLEYHFYGCIQDGYRMAYLDWVYVLRDYRRQGIAAQLFREFEKDCKKNGIHQYYLICAENQAAEAFYNSFDNAEIEKVSVFRKTF